MGRWRAIIPIMLALLIAVGGSMFIYDWMQQQTVQEPAVETVQRERPEVIKVAVAAIDIAAGTRLKSDFVQTKEYIKKNLPRGYFTSPADLEDRIALAPMQTNEPIIEHRLAPEDVRTGGVSAVISKGKRAVALGGDKVIGISGFIHAGNRVDVLVTWQDPESEDDITKRVLENVLVLATGTTMQETEKGDTAPVDVYTLEVTPEEAEILTHSRNQGRIQLALRNPGDNSPELTDGATSRLAMDYLHKQAGQTRLARQEAHPEPEQVAKPEPEPKPNPKPITPSWTVVEVIENNQVVERKF